MRNDMIKRAKQADTPEMRQNLLREELHHLILQEADRKGVFRHLSFVGGTALRILHKLNRFSEDLDFSLSDDAPSPFQFEPAVAAIQKSMTAYGLSCGLQRLKTAGAVHSCYFSFSNLLHDLDPQFRKGQTLAIKWDVDLNPPKGAKSEVSPVTGLRFYKVTHHDLPSLMAGKLNAVLARTYVKGRDLYDFLWYAGHRIQVNALLLQNGLFQIQKTKIEITTESLHRMLAEKFENIDFKAARADVERFMIDPQELDLFEREIFLKAISQIRV